MFEELRNTLDLVKYDIDINLIPVLTYAITYHDVIYNAYNSESNEINSYKFALTDLFTEKYEINSSQEDKLKKLIMATKYPYTNKEYSTLELYMIYLDLCSFTDSVQELTKIEKNIMKEYQQIPFSKYKVNRLKVLRDIYDSVKNLTEKYKSFTDLLPFNKVLEGIKTQQVIAEGFNPKIGIYVGSFEPFHIGHRNILIQAERVFDKVIILKILIFLNLFSKNFKKKFLNWNFFLFINLYIQGSN